MRLTHAEYEEDDGVLCIRCCVRVFSPNRRALGYYSCLTCGQVAAKQIKHMVVPVPKSNYIYAHTLTDLISPYSHKGNR